tara:strand:+ start:2786 stop:2995 length:210 start_codon:yes stop_codon:yes gene_type:complete
MTKTKRTPKQMEKLSKDVIEYYFNNPHANGSKYMQKKFNVGEVKLRKILTKELDRRFENSIARKWINKS